MTDITIHTHIPGSVLVSRPTEHKGKGLGFAISLVASVAIPFAAPAIATAIGVSSSIGVGLVGAALGAGAAFASGQNPLLGAAAGGATGFFGAGGFDAIGGGVPTGASNAASTVARNAGVTGGVAPTAGPIATVGASGVTIPPPGPLRPAFAAPALAPTGGSFVNPAGGTFRGPNVPPVSGISSQLSGSLPAAGNPAPLATVTRSALPGSGPAPSEAGGFDINAAIKKALGNAQARNLVSNFAADAFVGDVPGSDILAQQQALLANATEEERRLFEQRFANANQLIREAPNPQREAERAAARSKNASTVAGLQTRSNESRGNEAARRRRLALNTTRNAATAAQQARVGAEGSQRSAIAAGLAAAPTSSPSASQAARLAGLFDETRQLDVARLEEVENLSGILSGGLASFATGPLAS